MVKANLPEVRGVYVRDLKRSPLREGIAIEVRSAITFRDGDVMLFAEDSKGQSGPGILLPRDAVWAIKART